MFASGADSVDRYLGSSRYVDPWKGDGLQDGYRAQEWLPIGSLGRTQLVARHTFRQCHD